MPYIINPQIDELRESILNNRITNLYGVAGIGKTTLCRQCLDIYFPSTFTLVLSLYDFYHITNKRFYIPQSLHTMLGGICVIDDFDEIGNSDSILDYIYNSSSQSIKFIVIARNKINSLYTSSIEVNPLSHISATELFDVCVGTYGAGKSTLLSDLINKAKGNPLLIKEIASILKKNPSLMNREADIIYNPCIVDSEGHPLDSADNNIKIIVSEINDQVLYDLAQNPEMLHHLTPRDFERVIAKMFEKEGYSVKITPQTRDGGKDIFVATKDHSSFLYYVECKKYKPNRPVGIDVIQRMYGTISAERVNGGFIVTTSYFTKPATDYIQEYNLQRQLNLRDYEAITNILKDLQHPQ